MKKYLLILIMFSATVSMMAQKKGDMSVTGNFSISGGNYKTIITADGSTNTSKVPNSLNFNFEVEYGYFFADNWKAAIALGYNLKRTYNGNEDGEDLFDYANEFVITPNINYYLKIVPKLYYTPGIDVYVAFGNKKTDLDASSKEKVYSSTKAGFRFNLVAFEFRATDRFAVSLELGDFGFYSLKTKYSSTERRVSNNVSLNIKNSASVGFKYYFK